MKRTITNSVIALIIGVAFIACDKSENNNSTPTLRTVTYFGKTDSSKTYKLTITESQENALKSSSAGALRSSSEYIPQAGDTYELINNFDTLTSAGKVKSYESYVMILIAGKCWFQEFQVSVTNYQISTILGEVEYMTEEACVAKRHDYENFIVDLLANPNDWNKVDNDDNGGEDKENTDSGGKENSGENGDDSDMPNPDDDQAFDEWLGACPWKNTVFAGSITETTITATLRNNVMHAVTTGFVDFEVSIPYTREGNVLTSSGGEIERYEIYGNTMVLIRPASLGGNVIYHRACGE